MDLVLCVRVRMLWQLRARSVEADAAAGCASYRRHHRCANTRGVAREHESEYAVGLVVMPTVAMPMPMRVLVVMLSLVL